MPREGAMGQAPFGRRDGEDASISGHREAFHFFHLHCREKRKWNIAVSFLFEQ